MSEVQVEAILEIGDMITPDPNMVLIEVITESSEYLPGITRVNKGCEPYQKVIAVGKTDVPYFAKPGDYVLCRPELQFKAFSIAGHEYTLLFKHEIQAVLDPAILSEFRSDKRKDITIDKKQDLIN